MSSAILLAFLTELSEASAADISTRAFFPETAVKQDSSPITRKPALRVIPKNSRLVPIVSRLHLFFQGL